MSEWSSIRAAYEAGRHTAFPVDGGFRFRNPGQQWSTQFDGRGFVTTPDTSTWSWGLELQSYGIGADQKTVGNKANISAEGQSVSYNWDDTLTEWYKNHTRGLEHGFTVKNRPGNAKGFLTLTLGVKGELSPRVLQSRRDVSFVNKDGASVLNYSNLTVFDARGKTLPAHFGSSANELCISVDDSGAHYPLTIDPIAQQAYLKASNTGVQDEFGFSVSVSGNTVVVGAPAEDSAATGVDGDQSDNSTFSAGAAYVFVRSGTTWSQQAYLKASNTGPFDRFGLSVSISGDTVVVGARFEASNATGVNGNQADNSASNAGAAYVFVRTGTNWSQQAYLKASNTGADDRFGEAVSISGDTVVVGARLEDSTATGVDGDQNDNSASSAGAAYVFIRSGSTWTQEAYLKASNTGASDRFGSSVAVSGNTVVVGASLEDSSAMGVDGDQNDNSVSNSGAAYVYLRSGSTWSQEAYLKASNTDPNDNFGSSVAISGNTVVVGAHGENSNATGVNGDQANNDASFSGAVYVFVRSGTNWGQQAYLKASNTGAADEFGWSVSVSGTTVVVGGYREDSSATGVNGDQSDNTASASGAVYIFELDNNLGIAVFGTGTPGCSGTQTLSVNHAPMINSPHFTISCDNAPALSVGLGLITDSPDFTGSDPFALGVLLHADFAQATEIIPVDLFSDATGYAETVGVTIPNNPAVIGVTYYACALWAWPTSICTLPGFNPFNLSTSRGLAITILAP